MSRVFLKLFFGVSLIFSMVGCQASYTRHRARLALLPPKASVMVGVLAPGYPAQDQEALEAYCQAALVNRGIRVTTNRTSLLVSPERLSRVLPSSEAGKYSAGEGISHGLQAGAVIEGESSDVELLLKESEASDSVRRFEHLEQLLKAAKDSGAEFVLSVYRFSEYGYAARLIRAKDRLLLNVLVVASDADGFGKALGPPRGGYRSSSAEDGDVSHLDYMRLATRIASELR